jgi:hypothetical protein
MGVGIWVGMLGLVPVGGGVRVTAGGSEVPEGRITGEAGYAGAFAPAQAVRTAVKKKTMTIARVFIRSNIS